MTTLSDDVRPSTPEELAADSRHILAPFEPKPKPVLVPYEAWSREVGRLMADYQLTLAIPEFLGMERSINGRSATYGDVPMVDDLIRFQERSYRAAYNDPRFVIDRSRLSLPRDRLEDIKEALIRGEVDYPLMTCLPRVLTWMEKRRTLHRVLLDRLFRPREIHLWERDDFVLNMFMEQVRDLTTADLTRTDLTDPDGNPVAFTAEAWLRYLQALYPTLPRPMATPGYTDLSFVKWRHDVPADLVIEGATTIGGRPLLTIANRSQIDAVAHRYPLITLSRYLVLFRQAYALPGECLDRETSSWTFGIVDPQRSPYGPSVDVRWHAGGLILHRRDPRYACSDGRLRVAR